MSTPAARQHGSFAAVALDAPEGRASRSLELWIRAGGVASAAAVAWVASLVWSRTGELAYVLSALAEAGVSLLCAWWLPILAMNLVAAGLLFAVGRSEAALARWLRRPLFQLNRQLGHFEALFAWLTVTLVATHQFVLQMLLAALLLSFGSLLVDLLGWLRRDRVARDRLELNEARRVFFYVMTVAGLGTLSLLDLDQAPALLPVALSVFAGLVLRSIYFERRSRSPPAPKLARRSTRLDRTLVTVALAVAPAMSWCGLSPGLAAEAHDVTERTMHWTDCDPRAAEFVPEASLFVAADTQFHALDGERSGFQLDLIDDVVPVAARPIELDLLSGVTLAHFADLYRSLLPTRPGMLWAHLGDIGDLGCAQELGRFVEFAGRYGVERAAAVIPGNHDSSFLGNFGWHPLWKKACNGPRSDPAAVRAFLARNLPANARTLALTTRSFAARIADLGRLRNGKRVIGAFLDTSDYGAISVGIAGAQGAISGEQLRWVRQALAGDDVVVLFLHHTTAELSWSSRSRLSSLAAWLGSRLLAVVSAHTHLPAHRTGVRLGGRNVDEIVVGSTIDPPQEATLLDFRTSAAGLAELRATSIQAISRPGLSCAGEPIHGIPAERCERIVASLSQTCPMLAPDPAGCGGIGAPPEHPGDPRALQTGQERRAIELLDCLGIPAGTHPLQDRDVFSRLQRADAETAVCLSWAASVRQGHKGSRWTLGCSARRGFAADAVLGGRAVVVPALPASAVSQR